MRPSRAGGPARISSFTPSRERRAASGASSFMDEMIGDRHVKVRCELGELVPGKTLVWQLRRPLFRLPVRLVLRLNDDDTGLQIEQLIEAGTCCCKSRPHVQAALSTSLAAAKDEHVRTEFPKLRDFLRKRTTAMCRC